MVELPNIDELRHCEEEMLELLNTFDITPKDRARLARLFKRNFRFHEGVSRHREAIRQAIEEHNSRGIIQ